MVPVSRRRLLVSSVVATVGGSVASTSVSSQDSSSDDETLDPDDLPENLQAALEWIPTSVDEELTSLTISRVQAEEADEPSTIGAVQSTDQFGLEPSEVDRVVTAQYDDFAHRLIVAAGSFDSDDVDPSAQETTASEPATHVEDGLAVFATGQDGAWDEGLEAASDAAETDDGGLLATYALDALFEPVTDAEEAHVVRLDTDEIETEFEEDFGVDPEHLDVAVMGREVLDETTQEQTFVFLFEDAEHVDRDVVEPLVDEGLAQDDADDATYETIGRRLVASVETPLPEYRLPDDSPDLRFRFTYEDGTVSIEAHGEETADPEHVELLSDGEPADEQPWADGTESIDPGDEFEVSADLFAAVEVRWHDPEREGVSHTLGQSFLGGHGQLFSERFQEQSGRLVIRYEHDEVVDASRLELQHRSADDDFGEATTEPLDERVDELRDGTQITVDDVGYGDAVSLRVSTDDDGRSYARSVYHFRARPPGSFEVERDGEDTTLVYQGDRPQRAEHFRVSVAPEGTYVREEYEPTDAQWADEHEMVTPGAVLELDGLEIGTRGYVEWVGTDEPVHVDFFQIRPDASFSLEYDADDDAVAIVHDGGEALQADELSAVAYRDTSHEEIDAFDEHETVEAGDETTVELPGDPGDDAHAFVLVEYGDDVSLEHLTVDPT